MKISLTPGTGAVVRVKTKDGQTFDNEQVESIEFVPFFSMNNGQGEIFAGESKSEAGHVGDRFVLVASGANGKVKRVNPPAEKSVLTLFDRPRGQPKPAATPKPASESPPAPTPPTQGGKK